MSMSKDIRGRLASAGRATVCWSCIAAVFLLLFAGCRSEYTITDVCDCTEPMSDDPAKGDDGDEHESFDFEVANPAAIPVDGSGSIEELEDFDLAWTVEYHWDPCTAILHVHAPFKTYAYAVSSTAGTSGPVTMRYSLSDSKTAEVLLDGSVSADLLMGTMSSFSIPYEGAAVATESARMLLFEVSIEASPGQECPDDFSNFAAIQDIAVQNCPCANGDDSNDLHPTDLSWDPATSTLSWFDDYAWVRCGREENELTDAAAGFTETVTVWTLDGTVQFSDSRAGPSVPLNERILSAWPLDPSGWDPSPYLMQVDLVGLSAGIDCEATASKSVQVLVK